MIMPQKSSRESLRMATAGMGSDHDVVGEGVEVQIAVEEVAGVVEVGERGGRGEVQAAARLVEKRVLWMRPSLMRA